MRDCVRTRGGIRLVYFHSLFVCIFSQTTMQLFVVIRTFLLLSAIASLASPISPLWLYAQTPPADLTALEPTCSLQDKYGFLWFGGETGLRRWDGVEMRVFTRHGAESKALPSNAVTHLHEDGNGRLWIGTTKGLARFERHNETFSTVLPDKPISAVWEDSRVGLWIYSQRLGAHNDELFLLRNDSLRSFADIRGLQRFFVTAFAETAQGRFVWIGGAGGLARFDYAHNDAARQWTFPLQDATQAQSRVHALAADKSGRLLSARRRDFSR